MCIFILPNLTSIMKKTLTILLPLGFTALSSLAQQKAPNIVFILADDLGWTDLGCYGNKNHDTPHLDAMAANGIRFTDAYAACPVCSPTRASIMTGKYPARLQLTNFLVGNRTDPASPILPANWKPWLEARETTIAEILRDKGYTTGCIGKWHLGNHDSIAPWSQGFSHTRMIGKNGLDFYNYSIFMDSYQESFTDSGTSYLTDKLTEYGLEFINDNRDTPFFLYLAYSAPHVGIVPRGDKVMKYLFRYGRAEGYFNPYYAAMLESLDDGVGKIIEGLKENGLLENTIIIFTSDNGGLGLNELGPTPTSLLPLRKWKGHIYEGGIRVPAIISWKDKFEAGRVCQEYFSSIDYLPTLCELAGLSDYQAKPDGISIAALLLRNENLPAERPIFWHYPHFSNQQGRPAGAVRAGDYKLVENYETGKTELFNLKTDISESVNLARKNRQKTLELHNLLIEWRNEVQANMPLPNPDYVKK